MKNVLLLGANSDVGKALAKVYAQSGYTLTLASRSTTELQQFVAQNNLEATVLFFDATDLDSHVAFYEQLPEKPSVVVCAFGYLGDNLLANTSEKERNTILTTNFNGAVSILSIAVEAMKKQGKGIIIGISSVAGDRGKGSTVYYGAAKAGFTAYLSGLRNQLAHQNIHVMSVIPGYISSKMIAHLSTPSFLTSSPEHVAQQIYKAQQRKSNVIYVSAIWRLVMCVIKIIPEFIFKKLKL
ncbi:MAG: short-chain dehydrogenase [Crocinitomicaceae bacterium]|nr:short-chain dehydrogenase [Crocinitomicaceae bacterium]|tara:strand:+ start:2230 stop:2949 length:720 start_codon:yes stop_codon:yes gene_type:complete